jgi:uncharacterized integral membrane protein
MTEASSGSGGISPRVWISLAITVVVILFIVLNRAETSISFIFFRATTPLWVALALAAVGGFLSGFLLSRRRYRS